MDRRQFVRTSAAGMGAFAGGLGIKDLKGSVAADPGTVSVASLEDKVGRPVRIVSIGFTQGRPLEEIAELVRKEGERGTDLIALPETCLLQSAFIKLDQVEVSLDILPSGAPRFFEKMIEARALGRGIGVTRDHFLVPMFNFFG